MYALTLGMLQFEPFIQVYHSSLFEKYSKVHFKYNKTTKNGRVKITDNRQSYETSQLTEEEKTGENQIG